MLHIVVAALYAATLWLGLVAAVVYFEGPALTVAACGPLVVSGIIVVLYAFELVGWLVCTAIGRAADLVRAWMGIVHARS